MTAPTTSDVDLALTPLTGRFVAEVGMSLDAILADSAAHEAMRSALHEHKVLVLPGADPDPEQQIALGRVFGEPEPPQAQNPRHPDYDLICVLDSEGGYKADRWHADETFIDSPASGAVLIVPIQPDAGGDTLWLDTEAAYDALSNGMKTLIDNRRCRHEMAHGVEAVHPVVRTHPVTGRKCIYVNETFSRGIINLPPIESKAILGMLLEHVQRPDFTYRHRWSPGDIVIWDNRSTQHYAVADYIGRRQINRVGFVAEPFDD